MLTGNQGSAEERLYAGKTMGFYRVQCRGAPRLKSGEQTQPQNLREPPKAEEGFNKGVKKEARVRQVVAVKTREQP